MWTPEAVLLCAFALLGRSERSFPPIEFVTRAPADVSAKAEAYVRLNDPHIYIVTTSPTFRRLAQERDRCRDLMAARKLASILVHEETHVKRGLDEKLAYQAQLVTLTALGAGVGTPPYMEVTRAMREALKAQKHQPNDLLATAVAP